MYQEEVDQEAWFELQSDEPVIMNQLLGPDLCSSHTTLQGRWKVKLSAALFEAGVKHWSVA